MRILIFAILMIGSLSLSEAALKPVSETSSPPLTFGVIFGERLTQVICRVDGGKKSCAFANNNGVNRRRELSDKEYDFLLAKPQKWPEARTRPTGCGRKQVLLETNTNGQMRRWAGCLGGPGSLDKKLTSYAETIQFLFEN